MNELDDAKKMGWQNEEQRREALVQSVDRGRFIVMMIFLIPTFILTSYVTYAALRGDACVDPMASKLAKTTVRTRTVMEVSTAVAFDVSAWASGVGALVAFRRERTGLALGLAIMSATLSFLMFVGNAMASAFVCETDWN